MLRRLLSIGGFWLATAVTLVMALLPHPPDLPASPSDKVQHVIAFATLTALALAAYPAITFVRLLLPLSAFGALIEVLQAIPQLHRDSDPTDWMADTVAVAIVMAAVHLLRRLG